MTDVDRYNQYVIQMKILHVDKYISIGHDNFGYVLKNLDYNYPLETFVIPSFIYKLQDSCCSGTAVTFIALPATIREIGNNCFANCSNLKEIKIPRCLSSYQKSLLQSNKASIRII